jgi:hypothetical protein
MMMEGQKGRSSQGNNCQGNKKKRLQDYSPDFGFSRSVSGLRIFPGMLDSDRQQRRPDLAECLAGKSTCCPLFPFLCLSFLCQNLLENE